MKNIRKQTGQIMVITLLVLVIITIVVVSIILIVSEDVEQQVQTKEYEKYLDTGEEYLLNTMANFGPESALNTLSNTPSLVSPDASCSILDKIVSCDFIDEERTANVHIEVEDTRDIEDFVLGKDEFFTVYLGGYDDLLRVSWTGETAMGFTLDIKRGDEYVSIIDVYDQKGVLDSSGNNPLNDTAPTTHALEFSQYLSDTTVSTQFRLSNTEGLLSGDELISISFHPIIDSDYGSTLLSVTAAGSIDDQIRVYKATVYASDVETFGETPAPTVIAKVPLYPQIPAIFDYVLLTPTLTKGSTP